MRDIKDLIKIAIQPIGKTMYIYGGGWNEEDTGSGEDSMRIGISEEWVKFYREQNSEYDYTKTRYMLGKGLDCSGYVGWVIYNLMNMCNEEDKNGYVTKARDVARDFYLRGWGDYYGDKEIKGYRAGDIMSADCKENDCAHVWIVIGECDDGSVVLAHSSPPGVQINGTVTRDGEKSQAIELARKYMKKYYPEWYEKYPKVERDTKYLTHYGQFRWEILSDREKLQDKKAEEILKILYEE